MASHRDEGGHQGHTPACLMLFLDVGILIRVCYAFVYIIYCVMLTALFTAAAIVISTFALLRHGCYQQYDLWTASVEGST